MNSGCEIDFVSIACARWVEYVCGDVHGGHPRCVRPLSAVPDGGIVSAVVCDLPFAIFEVASRRRRRLRRLCWRRRAGGVGQPFHAGIGGVDRNC